MAQAHIKCAAIAKGCMAPHTAVVRTSMGYPPENQPKLRNKITITPTNYADYTAHHQESYAKLSVLEIF